MSDDIASPWMQGAESDCPVHRSMQGWLESSLRWFIDQFGPEVLGRDPILPTASFLTDKKYDGSSGQIEAIVRQLCDLMLVRRDRIKLELFDGSAEKREAAKRSGRTRAVGGLVRVRHLRRERGDEIRQIGARLYDHLARRARRPDA